ncbi:MAG: 30S ribosomal protein S20 [Candidatus Paceibacterota bacterium]
MPIIKSAQKKLRQDKRRVLRNLMYKSAYKKAIRDLEKKSKEAKISIKDLSAAYSAIDKAAKQGVIHTNRAARLKARISKLPKHT